MAHPGLPAPARWSCLAEQDRDRWHQDLIAEGIALVEKALATGPLGTYQLQAAIAGVHASSRDVSGTDWPQVLALYDLLLQIEPSPVVALNRAVAVAEVHGPAAGLGLVDSLTSDPRLARQHRLHAVRAHLRERIGDLDGARTDFTEAAARTANDAERTFLLSRAASLTLPSATSAQHDQVQRSTS